MELFMSMISKVLFVVVFVSRVSNQLLELKFGTDSRAQCRSVLGTTPEHKNTRAYTSDNFRPTVVTLFAPILTILSSIFNSFMYFIVI